MTAEDHRQLSALVVKALQLDELDEALRTGVLTQPAARPGTLPVVRAPEGKGHHDGAHRRRSEFDGPR